MYPSWTVIALLVAYSLFLRFTLSYRACIFRRRVSVTVRTDATPDATRLLER